MDYQYYPLVACSRGASMTSRKSQISLCLSIAVESTWVMRSVRLTGETKGTVITTSPVSQSNAPPPTALVWGV